MGRRLVPHVTCLLAGLLTPLGLPQNPGTPSIFVAAFTTIQGAQRLAPCRPAGVPAPARVFPGPALLPAVLKPSSGIVPDARLRAAIENEILKHRAYRLSGSIELADYVFYVQATLGFAAVVAQPSEAGRPGVRITFGGDQPPNQFVSFAAFVTPAGALPADPTKLAAGLESALWRGYATPNASAFVSPSALVDRFHRDFKGKPTGELAWISGERDVEPGRGGPTALCAPPQPAIAGDLDLSQAAGQPLTGAPSVSSSSSAATRPVLVPVVVRDGSGAPLSDLQASDFHVYENDVAQTIDAVLSGSTPLNVAVVVDTSLSMRQQVRASSVAASAFIDALGADDAVMMVSFDSRAYLASDLSRNRAVARRALVGLASGSDTCLYDTLVATVERLDPVPGRKVILLLSDGLDVASAVADARIAQETVESSDAALYVLQFDTTHDAQAGVLGSDAAGSAAQAFQRAARFAEATDVLGALSAATGGRLSKAVAEQLTADAAGIAEELQGQYVLSYRSSGPAVDASPRRIRVTVDRSGVTVRSRTARRAVPAHRVP